MDAIEVAKWFDPETGKGYCVFEFTKENYENWLKESEEQQK